MTRFISCDDELFSLIGLTLSEALQELKNRAVQVSDIKGLLPPKHLHEQYEEDWRVVSMTRAGDTDVVLFVCKPLGYYSE